MITAWALTCLGLMILPGPDMALVTKTSLSKGWRGGVSVVAGIYISFTIYSVAILAGIIPLLNAWPDFFLIARVLGGGYLIYLGIKGVMEAQRKTDIGPGPVSGKSLIFSGFVSNALNAKQYIFLFLLLPSFLPNDPSVSDNLILLGVLAVVSTLFWAVWIFMTTYLGQRMKTHHRKIETMASVALVAVGCLLIFGVI